MSGSVLNAILVSFCTATFFFGSAGADPKAVKRYRIAERTELLETSPFVLTMASHDLERFPRSVVTFTVSTEKAIEPNRAIASHDQNVTAIPSPALAPVRLSGRRHLSMIDDNEFGRGGRSDIIFNRKSKTVFISFVGQDGKLFYYKEIAPSAASEKLARD